MKKKTSTTKPLKKYKPGGEEKKPGRVEYNPGTPRGTRLSMDTTGYSAGQKRFPVEITYSKPGIFGDGKRYSMVNRKDADNFMKQQQAKDAGKPSQFPSFLYKAGKKAEKAMTTPKKKMGGSCGTPKSLTKRKK